MLHARAVAVDDAAVSWHYNCDMIWTDCIKMPPLSGVRGIKNDVYCTDNAGNGTMVAGNMIE